MKLPKLITKRNGDTVEFKSDKIFTAINKARIQTEEFDLSEVKKLTDKVLKEIEKHNDFESLTVEKVQDFVESVLLESKHKATAKAYIIYREKRSQARKPDIFKFRLNLKPFEYPDLAEYKEAIQHSYWLHTEFNYTSDIHDFKVNVNDSERNAIKNSMLAIAQVEVAVKTFWGDLYKRIPKPEIGAVGFTFAESEVRHQDAYAHLLEVLGLSAEFERLEEFPALRARVRVLDKHLKRPRSYDPEADGREHALTVLLFAAFV